MGGLFGGGQNVSISAPIVASLRLQTSAYGRCVPLVYGRTRISGNLGWYNDFTAIPHTTTQSSGGKGGGGGSTSQTDYTYTAAAIMFLCEGPITNVLAVWADKSQYTPAALGLSTFTGSATQNPFSYVTTNHPAEALGYRRTAYMATGAYSLGSNASMPNHTFEVVGMLPFDPGGGPDTIQDANPADVLSDYLTDPVHGVGFPSGGIGSLTNFSNYCVASGIFISPAYTEQSQASDHVTRLAALGNSALVFSEGILKVIPYGDQTVTGNGVTFTPNSSPVYALTDDDFIENGGGDPVIVSRANPADAFNQVQVKFYNRENQYAEDVAEAKDQANIELYGLRPMQPVEMHEICSRTVARALAQITLQRVLYKRNSYRFQLGWKYAGLEPMDLLTLTEGSGDGVSGLTVRIISVEEDADGLMSVEAEDYLGQVNSHVAYPSQPPGGYVTNYNQTPGNVAPPAIFELPFDGVNKKIRIGLAVSGLSAIWGGCNVWVSLDNATYKRVAIAHGGARYGTLQSAINALPGAAPDVLLAGLGGQMLSGTAQDADQYHTACYLDGEFISYESSTLTAANRYTLGNLRRGGYGSTAASHSAGTCFVRLDDAIVESDPLDLSMIGGSVYFKFTSFNVYGSGNQDLSSVLAYQYIVKGVALTLALNNVQNLVGFFRAGRTVLAWDVVADVRDVDYEIRKGAAWATAQILGRTPNTEFITDGDGTYWVSAHSWPAYSATPAALVIDGGALVSNVVATFDEEATLWPGACAGGAAVIGTNVELVGSGMFSAIPQVSVIGSVLFYGGVSGSGSYTIPASHEVDVGTAQPCNCSVSYRLIADNPYSLFSSVPDVAALKSLGGNFSGVADVKIQIAIAPDSGVYGAWKDFIPGVYVGRKFKFCANLSSSDTTVTAILDKFVFTVDMPDRVERGTSVSCPADGLTVAYTKPFQIAPNVQITILNASQNDDVVLSAQTPTGFTVRVLNGGVGVDRTINWLSQAY